MVVRRLVPPDGGGTVARINRTDEITPPSCPRSGHTTTGETDAAKQRLLDDVSPRRHPPRPPPHPPNARWSPTLLASQPSPPPTVMSERWR
ncbi:hypothetical protein E2C01_073886 [Portunus trituberculatus]|uniref:Uncharacterized protein n=1 Tax=Portunus trituberculatus TaxID=210409 RepID=A0A5B7IAN8_PORTR|nr:hypothetical protein [Portunus trituberculatus]